MKQSGKIKKNQELQAGQPHLNPWESDGANNPQNHLYIYEGQEGDWEQSAWIHDKEIMPDQPDSLLGQNDQLGGQGESSGYCLS